MRTHSKFKSERRQSKRTAKRGMQVGSKSVLEIQRLQRERAEKLKESK